LGSVPDANKNTGPQASQRQEVLSQSVWYEMFHILAEQRGRPSVSFKYCHAKVTTERYILGLGLLRTLSNLIFSLLTLLFYQKLSRTQGFLLQLKYPQMFILLS